jgi:aspartate racemase
MRAMMIFNKLRTTLLSSGGVIMKTIGLIGGLSWESTIEYYRLLNMGVKKRLGGLHSAQCVLYSFDFAGIEELQYQGCWDEATQLMISAAQSVERAGADFLLICSNTMHRMADDVQRSIDIPLLHIADATAQQITAQHVQRVGLLATAFTMEQDFYKGRLTQKYGLNVLVPAAEERKIVHDIIYGELCLGEIRQASKEAYQRIIEHLVSEGAEAIIAGCTEIMLLISQKDCSVPLFDTTSIHVEAAIELALQTNPAIL